MKLFRNLAYAAWVLLLTLAVAGCSEDETIDNRDRGYGYVQFKLYKAASYEAQPASAAARGVQLPLDYLADAVKVRVVLDYNETTLSQTLALSAADAEAAEYGLRSDKLKLMAGNYRLLTYTLYNSAEEAIYVGSMAQNEPLEVVEGGLTVHDLTVDVTARGGVRFTLKKDFSEFSRSVMREYTFDEIAYVNLTVRNTRTNRTTKLEKLPTDFSLHFDEEDDEEDGYRTSSQRVDTLLRLPAGGYELLSYETYDERKVLLEQNSAPTKTTFTVADNAETEADIPVKLYESDEYIKDYYALYEIWKSLDGEQWSYYGENYPQGANWDFNKDCDLWGDQPGVQLHPNGRVARLDISDFGFRGDLSPQIGQLTELIELYLGTHNDVNLWAYDPIDPRNRSLAELKSNRMAYHKQYLEQLHTPTQFSEPCARALAEHQISIPATRLYDTKRESEIIDPKSGAQIRPYDTHHGTLCNGLKSLPKEIGKLQKLEILYIANSAITALPDELAELTSCTDIELYNCPNMTQFPMAIAEMPELISLNLSNNRQWSAEEAYKGFDALAKGPSKEKIQILYARENALEELPASFSGMQKLALLDLSYNNISKISPLTSNVAPVQLYLDHNALESIPVDESGYFCSYADIETFSITFNKLKKFPNIFSAKSNFTIKSIDFSGNDIRSFEGEEDGSFRGVKVETLSLSQNYNLKSYPVALAKSNSQVAYIILRACGLERVPKGSFTYEYSSYLVSLDLSYNNLTDLPYEFHAGNMPYLYGVDLSFNSFSKFPYEPLDAAGLTVLAVRSQRDAEGRRCLQEWPTGIYQHVGLRGLYLGSNDLREVNDTISTLCYYLDISDNPQIEFDASDICYAWQAGAYILIYDKWQNIINCDLMLE